MNFILQWIDFIWLPIILFIARKEQRLIAVGLFLSCALMMRMQIELVESTGFLNGFTPFVTASARGRAIATYNVFYFIYVLLVYLTPRWRGSIFLAVSLTIFFAAMTTSMLVMIL